MPNFVSLPHPSAPNPRRHSFLVLCLVALALALLATGCAEDEVKLGIVLPLSGADEAAGESVRRGIELGLEELQATGSTVAFTPIFADSASDPEAARAELERLIREEGVIATIGGVTPAEARAQVPVAEERERVLLLTSVGDQSLTRDARYVYRIAPSNEMSGSTLATFVANKLEADTAVVLAEDATFAETVEEGFHSTFESLEHKMLDRLEAPSTDGDLSAAVATIDEAAPDAVMLAGDGEWLTAAVGRLREADYEGRLLALPAFAHPGTLAATGTEAGSVLFAHPPFDAATGGEALSAFVEAYRAKYGEAPDLYAAQGYDALKVYAIALEGRPPLAGEVRRWIRDHVKDVQGLTGTLQFDEAGGLSTFPRVYAVDDSGALYDYGDRIAKEEEERQERLRKLKEEYDRLLEERAAAAGGEG